MDILERNPKQRYLIKARLASDTKAAWHVYKRFCSKDQRDKELAKAQKNPKVNFLAFKASSL